MSYAALGQSYLNLGEGSLATENTRKAYELREQVSERERYFVETHYYDIVTGDLERARQFTTLGTASRVTSFRLAVWVLTTRNSANLIKL